MLHPILDKFWKILIYTILWIFITAIYFYTINYIFKIDLIVSIIDSSLTFLILGTLYIGIWFYIRYNRFEEKKLWKVLIYILITGIIIVVFWIFINWLLLLFIQDDKNLLNTLLEKTLIFKFSFGLINYIFTTMIYYLITYYQNYRENQKRKEELSVLLVNSELSNLKSQINPHFLFNSLNSISYLIYSNPEDAHNSIVKLSDYFRYSLSKSNDKFTTLKDELENIFRYLDIEKIRFNDKMNIIKDIDEKCLNYKMPVIILQPLIENAVKHGVYESTEVIDIEINAKDYSDFFTVEIKNNYIKEFQNKKGTSTGLKNVSKRLNLTYNREDLIKINKKENYFSVIITFPKNIKL